MPRAVLLLLLAPLFVSGCALFAAPCDTAADCDEGACVEGFCDPGTPPADDAGPRRDAGPDEDAGPGLDAGPARDAGPGTDAGPVRDAGYDAGPAPDAGPHASYKSTLDDDMAILSPIWGSGSGYVLTTYSLPAFFPELTPAPARVTLLLDAANEQLELPVAASGSTNADMRTGSLTVDYKPIYAHADDTRHLIFSIEDAQRSPPALLQLRKANASNTNNLQLAAYDGTSNAELNATLSDITLTTGQWYRLHVTWDFRGATDELKLYIDGVSVGTVSGNGDLTMPQPDAAQWLVIGGRRPSLGNNALAQFDNLEVWREVRPPPP
jgi:hypothetical protein